jgi:alpha-L-rhamnosidase
VAPHRCGLTHAHGSVCTPRGEVRVSWREESGAFMIEIDAPADTPVHVRLPNGAQHTFPGGRFSTVMSEEQTPPRISGREPNLPVSP